MSEPSCADLIPTTCLPETCYERGCTSCHGGCTIPAITPGVLAAPLYCWWWSHLSRPPFRVQNWDISVLIISIFPLLQPFHLSVNTRSSFHPCHLICSLVLSFDSILSSLNPPLLMWEVWATDLPNRLLIKPCHVFVYRMAFYGHNSLFSCFWYKYQRYDLKPASTFLSLWSKLNTCMYSLTILLADEKGDVPSPIAEISRITPSPSLPSVHTLQKTKEKGRTSLKKGHLSVEASSETSNKEKAVDYNATRPESGKNQSRGSLSTKRATSNYSTSAVLDLIPSNDKLPVEVSTFIGADYMTVLLGSRSVLPSKRTSFREPSPSVDSGFTNRDLYLTSSVVPIWTANMLGNAYGGGYVVTPSIFVTSFPDSPSSSGIPPGYEISPKSEDFQYSRPSTRVSVSAGGVLALIPGPSKEEATLGVSNSSSALDALPTGEIDTASFTQISSSASNHNLFKPVAGTEPSLASTIPINETDKLNTSLLPPSASVNLGLPPLISPLLVNQSVIGAYIPTSAPEFQGLAFKKTVDCSLGLICTTVLFFFL